MARMRDLSQAEFEVMDILWQRGRSTVRQVQAALGRERELAYTTVATLLNRLREKGYVEARERNFAYEFRPLVRREQVVRRKLDDLVKRVLRGSVAPLAAYIAESRKLTPEQLATLEEIAGSETTEEAE